MPHYLKKVRTPRAKKNMAIRFGGLEFGTNAELWEFLTVTMGFSEAEARTELKKALTGKQSAPTTVKPARSTGKQSRREEVLGGFGRRSQPTKKKTPRTRKPVAPVDPNGPIAYPTARNITRAMGGMQKVFPRFAGGRVEGSTAQGRLITAQDVMAGLKLTESKGQAIWEAILTAGAQHEKGLSSSQKTARQAKAESIFTRMSGIPVPLK